MYAQGSKEWIMQQQYDIMESIKNQLYIDDSIKKQFDTTIEQQQELLNSFKKLEINTQQQTYKDEYKVCTSKKHIEFIKKQQKILDSIARQRDKGASASTYQEQDLNTYLNWDFIKNCTEKAEEDGFPKTFFTTKSELLKTNYIEIDFHDYNVDTTKYIFNEIINFVRYEKQAKCLIECIVGKGKHSKNGKSNIKSLVIKLSLMQHCKIQVHKYNVGRLWILI